MAEVLRMAQKGFVYVASAELETPGVFGCSRGERCFSADREGSLIGPNFKKNRFVLHFTHGIL